MEPTSNNQSADSREPTPERIGPWELRRRIGRGGMADVWMAVRADGAYRRRVAIKKLHPAMASGEVVARFERERQILASLSHPGISKLLEAGTTADGTPYIVMELVDGQRLDRFADERRLGIRARVRLVVEIADAVMAAHRMHVVHRDLKPSNVLIDLEGRPTLLDFGVAKVLDPEKAAGDRVTRDVNRFLTPNYASPEQLAGEPLHAPSDVYSLAALTYELLCGSPPLNLSALGTGDALKVARDETPRPMATAFSEHDDPEALARARGETSPALLGRDLRNRDLAAVTMAGLRKEPGRRPPDAGAFRDELVRWLEGRAVQSAADTWVHGVRRVVGRHRLASLLAAMLLVVTLIGVTRIWLDRQRLRATYAQLAQETDDAAQRGLALRESVTALLQDTIVNLGGIPGTEHAVDRLTRTGIRLAEAQNDPHLSMPLGLTIVQDMQRQIDLRGSTDELLERGRRGVSLAQNAASQLGLEARPILSQARRILSSKLETAGHYEEALAQADLAAEDIAAVVRESVATTGKWTAAQARIDWTRSNIRQSTGQFALGAECARAGLDLIERAQRDFPALAEDLGGPSPGDPLGGSGGAAPSREISMLREVLLNLEADLQRSLLQLGAPRRERGDAMDPSNLADSAGATGAAVRIAKATASATRMHGPNVTIGSQLSNVYQASVGTLLGNGQRDQAGQLLAEAKAWLPELRDGGQGSLTVIVAHARFARTSAQLLLTDPPSRDRDAELDRLSRELSGLSVRLELETASSFQQRKVLANLLATAGSVEAERGRLMEAAARLNRAYSIYHQNSLESPDSLSAATGQCRLAAQMADLSEQSGSNGDEDLWRARAVDHYGAIRWDQAAKDEFTDLRERVFPADR